MRVLWPLVVVVLSVAVIVEARSTGPPASTVVADDGCSCHGASPNAGTTVEVEHPSAYLSAPRHRIRITSSTDVIQNPAGNKGGFLAWASHGSFAKREGSQDWYQVESLEGRSVIKHNLEGDRSNPAQEWSFDWIAPSSDVGTATLKVWVNRVDGDGTASSLDHWNRKHVSIVAGSTTSPTPTRATTTSAASTSSQASSASQSATPTESTSTPAVGTGALLLGALAAAASAGRLLYPRR